MRPRGPSWRRSAPRWRSWPACSLEKEVVDREEFVKLIDGDGQKQVLAG